MKNFLKAEVTTAGSGEAVVVEVLFIQSGNYVSTENETYGVGTTDMRKLEETVRDMFLNSSEVWHRSMGIEETTTQNFISPTIH